MASISCESAAAELLRQCVAGESWDAELVRLLARNDCSGALFGILVEGLADRFEPRLCEAYAVIFTTLLKEALPQLHWPDLGARYRRVRKPRQCRLEPARVFVLSRVTLGADVAITSVVLDAVKQRFPKAQIYLAGGEKAAELFAADPRVQHFPVAYPRGGTLADRLASWRRLAADLPAEDAIVVDPDSRITQLGLLPINAEDRYFFFESRSYGGSGLDSLVTLTQRWTEATFGVAGARNVIQPTPESVDAPRPIVAVSLGTGDNVSKQLSGQFEGELIQFLCSRFATVVVDYGAGEQEAARVSQSVAGTSARTFQGSFARFASLVGQSDCYVGYDSAGQHAAAAFGTPLLTLFKGFVSDRMFARWQPSGPGPKQVLRIASEVSIDTVATVLKKL